MNAISPYRSLFDIDPFAPLFPSEYKVRSMMSDLMPEGFRLNIEDTDDAYVVTAHIAGVDKDDIDVQFDDGRLTIAVDHKETSEEKEKNYLHKETREWSASRSVMLHDTVREGIAAKLDNGVLTITVPKAKDDKAAATKVTID